MQEIQRYKWPKLGLEKQSGGEIVRYVDHERVVKKLEAALREARDFIASVECDDGLTTANLCDKIDAAIAAWSTRAGGK